MIPLTLVMPVFMNGQALSGLSLFQAAIGASSLISLSLYLPALSARTRTDPGPWITYTEAHGLASRGIRSLVAASGGTVWVTYDGWTYGLSRWDGIRAGEGSRSAWTTYTVDDGLPSNAVTSIAVAPDGALWVATEAGTVSRFADPITSTGDGQIWTTWTVQEITGEQRPA